MTAVETSFLSPEDSKKDTICMKRASSLKRVASLNLRERQSCNFQTKLIDMERKSLHAQLTKEEKDLKCQLMKLRLEKRALEDWEVDVDDDDQIDSVSVLADHWDLQDNSVHETEVINPYPVTIGRARKISAPCNTGLSKSWYLARGQTSSHEDLTSLSPNSVLPPIQRSHGRNLTSNGEVTPSLKGSPRGSVVSIQSSVPTIISGNGDHELWAGDPEAIQSIRRPKKSVAQQKITRLEHKWSRSRSLKENDGRRRGGSVSRSQSLREPQTPVGNTTPSSRGSSYGNLSRASSIKGSEYINDEPKYLVQRRRRSSVDEISISSQIDNMQIYSKDNRDGSFCSPDTEIGVWGWIKDVDPSEYSNEEPLIIRKSSKRRKSTNKQSLRVRTDHSPNMESPEESPNRLDLPYSKDHSPLLNSPKLKSKATATKIVPSPSHLSVEKCFEILASSPTEIVVRQDL